MKRYEGIRDLHRGVIVTVNNSELDARRDLHNHSPDGFEWGYSGSGPTQLALAILADALEDDRQALELYMDFRDRVIAHLPKQGWCMTRAQVLVLVEKISLARGRP